MWANKLGIRMAEKHFREMLKNVFLLVLPTNGIFHGKMWTSPAVGVVLESVMVSWTAGRAGRHGTSGQLFRRETQMDSPEEEGISQTKSKL